MANGQDSRASSRAWGEDILSDNGFRRVGNTSLFKDRYGTCVLSPGVGPGGNMRYWFDLRDAILDTVTDPDAHLLLRLVDQGFVLVPLNEFRQHLNDRTRRLTAAGPAYGFNCSFNGSTVTIKSSSGGDYSFRHELLDRDEAAAVLGRL